VIESVSRRKMNPCALAKSMKNTLENLKSLTDVYFSKLRNVGKDAALDFTVGELRQKLPEWWGERANHTWLLKTGVYFFHLDGEVKYIGEGTIVNVGARVSHHIKERAPKWAPMLDNPRSIVGVITFSGDNWFWSSSLEKFLIRELQPPLNDVGKKAAVLPPV
jgi:hypothetical protein